ncbi:hypothetical protein MMC07_007684 [Pseudocyphellaria aurata]|nr:hypothetical protein [Pseudocyphellaria aurata]
MSFRSRKPSRSEESSAQAQPQANNSWTRSSVIYSLIILSALVTAHFLRPFLPTEFCGFGQLLCTTQPTSQKPSSTAMTGPYDQFILFGDSITQQSCDQEEGFAFTPALQNAYIRRLDVINRGFSGYNTSQALAVLPLFMPTVAQAQIRFMAIFFGANDACLPESSTHQHVPLGQYKQNLRDIIAHKVVTIQKPRIILITPPPVDEYCLEEPLSDQWIPERQRTAEHTKQYADACREVGAEIGVVVLDLWSIFMAHAGWKESEPLPGSKKAERNSVLGELLRDGLHFTPKAYRLLYESMIHAIHKEWPDQDPFDLDKYFPYVLPDWRKFDKR